MRSSYLDSRALVSLVAKAGLALAGLLLVGTTRVTSAHAEPAHAELAHAEPSERRLVRETPDADPVLEHAAPPRVIAVSLDTREVGMLTRPSAPRVIRRTLETESSVPPRSGSSPADARLAAPAPSATSAEAERPVSVPHRFGCVCSSPGRMFRSTPEDVARVHARSPARLVRVDL